MTAIMPFQPVQGATQILTATATSQVVSVPQDSRQLRIMNAGAGLASIRTFSSRAIAADPTNGVATTADFPVVASQVTTITKGSDHDRMAYISAAGTTIYVTPGDGWQ